MGALSKTSETEKTRRNRMMRNNNHNNTQSFVITTVRTESIAAENEANTQVTQTNIFSHNETGFSGAQRAPHELFPRC